MTKLNKAKAETAASGNQTQSERFIAKARELGLDEREEMFDAALGKVARHKGRMPGAVTSEASFNEGLDKLATKPDSEKTVIKGS